MFLSFIKGSLSLLKGSQYSLMPQSPKMCKAWSWKQKFYVYKGVLPQLYYVNWHSDQICYKWPHGRYIIDSTSVHSGVFLGAGAYWDLLWLSLNETEKSSKKASLSYHMEVLCDHNYVVKTSLTKTIAHIISFTTIHKECCKESFFLMSATLNSQAYHTLLVLPLHLLILFGCFFQHCMIALVLRHMFCRRMFLGSTMSYSDQSKQTIH